MIGLVLMEDGAAGPNIYQSGYPNGASVAYLYHLGVFYLAYTLTVRVGRSRYVPTLDKRRYRPPMYTPDEFKRLAAAAFATGLAILLVLLFVCGAIDVVRGLLEKGQLRNEVKFAMFAYLARDFLTPMLAAVVAFGYKRTQAGATEHFLMAAVFVLAAVSGAVWGYRASSIMAILPALLILLPRLGAVRTIASLATAMLILTLGSMAFERLPLDQAIIAVLNRATVGTADSPWKLWEIASLSPESLPPYWPTLLAALGGRLGSFVAAAAGDPVLMVNLSDYSVLVTFVVKNFAPLVDTSSNVTTTVFGEGLLALGSERYLLFSLFAGMVTAVIRVLWLRGTAENRPVLTVLSSVYFITSILAWLNSGGIIVLFALPTLVYYAAAFIVLSLLLRWAQPSVSQPAAVPHRPSWERPLNTGMSGVAQSPPPLRRLWSTFHPPSE